MIQLAKPTIESVIEELLRRREEDASNFWRLKNGTANHEVKKRQLADYFVGRECAFAEAVTLLEAIKG